MLVLVIIGIGLATLLRIITPLEAGKTIGGFILAVILGSFLVSMLLGVWHALPYGQRALVFIVAVAVAAAMFRKLF